MRGDARWGPRFLKPVAFMRPRVGQEGPPLCQGLWAQKSSVQFQEVWLSSDEAPASCGSEGVRGVRGSIWGAGWRAWASCLAHGGGGGGRSLRRLPRGCISVGGNGSIVHTRFCSQTLFLGCKGAGSLGSQFSTGPGDKESRERMGIRRDGIRGDRLLASNSFEVKAQERHHAHPIL